MNIICRVSSVINYSGRGNMENFIKALNEAQSFAVTKFAFFNKDGKLVSCSDSSFFSNPEQIRIVRGNDEYNDNCESIFPCYEKLYADCIIDSIHYACCLTPCGDGGCVAEVWTDDGFLAMLKNEKISAYLEDIAASLRSNISKIYINAELLHHSLTDKELYDELEKLDAQSESCIALLSSMSDLCELLHYSRRDIIEAPINLSDTVTRLSRLLDKDLRRLGISVKSDIEDSVISNLSRERFVAAFMTMVSNAVNRITSYSEKKQLNISLRSVSSSALLSVSTPFPCSDANLSTSPRRELSDLVLKAFCEQTGSTVIRSDVKGGYELTIKLPLIQYDGDMLLGSRQSRYVESNFSTYNVYLYRILHND